MNRPQHLARSCAAGAVLALSSFAASAGFVTSGYFGTQGAPELPAITPPTLESNVAAAVGKFGADTTELGRHGFENGSTTFSFGAAASAAVGEGAPSIINGNDLEDGTLGRYNMTEGLPCLQPLPNGCGQLDRGKWLETQSSFSYSLTGGTASALAFFGTDFGDFDALVEIELLLGGESIFTQSIETIPVNGVTRMQAVNGNLIFFGVVGESDTDVFDEFRINISQFGGSTLDYLGIDSLVLGRSNLTGTPPGTVPTPTSLALTLLGLGLLAQFRRRR